MSNELKDILGNSNKDIDNQQLMAYLQQQLEKEEAHKVEEAMSDDPFMNDAMEGLQQMSDKQNIAGYVDQLNRDLQKKLEKKKQRKLKRRLANQDWVYFAIILMLVLCSIAYYIIKKFVAKIP